MASACVNNIAMSPDTSFAWLSPPKSQPNPRSSPPDFEFSLQDPVAMLPADQLFSNGKLVPLHLTSLAPSSAVVDTSPPTHVSSTTEPSFFSPKAPRCSSRWKDLLGLKKLCLTTNAAARSDTQKTTPSSNASKSLKHFLYKTSKSSSSSSFLSSSLDAASLSLPLLKESDCESVSISSRHSLSSSSSGHEYEDLPRLSLDSDRLNPNPISLHRNPNSARPRVRLVKPRAASFDSNNQRSSMDYPTGTRAGRSPVRRAPGEGSRGGSVDSPRMNSSGKIVFQSLERSSSSPSTLNGGPRYKYRGMERSYSANVRVTPVLNVPVCSLRGSSKSGSVFGFGQLFSCPQKKEGAGNGGSSMKGHQQYGHGRNRCDRN